MVDNHKLVEVPRLQTLQQYYVGEHPIRDRVFADDSKANNKLVHNFPTIITNQLTSFGFGAPVSYTSLSSNINYLNPVKEINKNNNEPTHNLALATTMSIFGNAYELVYFDEGELKFAEIPVHETFMIYDNSIKPKPIISVRYYTISNWDGNLSHYVEIRTSDVTNIYTRTTENRRTGIANVTTESTLNLLSSEVNLLGKLPVVRYFNNNEILGDWENSLELINGYNILQSDAINESEAFADSYLVINGMPDSKEDDFREMRRNRVLLLDGEGAKAEWLTKSTDHQTAEALKSRVKEDIYTMSGTLDMNELANTSHISGSAIRYKLLQTESVIKKKEQNFKTALYERLRLITSYLNLRGGNYDYKDIQLVFTRNLPIDYQTVAEFASKVSGVISKQTLFETLDFIEDSSIEMERVRQERAELAFGLDMYDDIPSINDNVSDNVIPSINDILPAEGVS